MSCFQCILMIICCVSMLSCSIVSYSLQPHRVYPPGSSVHGTFQARILECIAISSSKGSSQSRDQTCVSCIIGGFLTCRAFRKAQNKIIVWLLRITISVGAVNMIFHLKRRKHRKEKEHGPSFHDLTTE